MITHLSIRNFRSIRELNLPVKPLTVIYGQNGSGKSSVMYAPLVLKNIVMNPAQQMVNFFNLNFLNLGGFEQVVRKHKTSESIVISVTAEEMRYGVSLNPSNSRFTLSSDPPLDLKVSFPYNLSTLANYGTANDKASWNGITAQIIQKVNDDSPVEAWVKRVNALSGFIKSIEIISAQRGFRKPFYNQVPITPFYATEDEVASVVVQNNGYLIGTLNHYIESIFGKRFQIFTPLNSPFFYLRITEKRGDEAELVNEGFGINQTLYMLIKILKEDTSLAMIEEPEINLHPSAQAKLVDAFIDITREHNKQILFSTHSETMVTTILTRIAEGKISKDDIAFYLCEKTEHGTTLIPQTLNDKGQVEGGLMAFMETELENLRNWLGVKE
jgi:predicted ATPase